jgi:hypothetical protein
MSKSCRTSQLESATLCSALLILSTTCDLRNKAGGLTWSVTWGFARGITGKDRRSAAWGITWDTTWDAARAATWDITWNVTRDGTWDTTWDITRK